MRKLQIKPPRPAKRCRLDPRTEHGGRSSATKSNSRRARWSRSAGWVNIPAPDVVARQTGALMYDSAGRRTPMAIP